MASCVAEASRSPPVDVGTGLVTAGSSPLTRIADNASTSKIRTFSGRLIRLNTGVIKTTVPTRRDTNMTDNTQEISAENCITASEICGNVPDDLVREAD